MSKSTDNVHYLLGINTHQTINEETFLMLIKGSYGKHKFIIYNEECVNVYVCVCVICLCVHVCMCGYCSCECRHPRRQKVLAHLELELQGTVNCLP